MTIRKLTMQNLGPYAGEHQIALGRFNMFSGQTGAGKSTILDAIALGLTGSVAGDGSRRGRSLGDLRHRGSKRKWGLELQLDTEDGFQRFTRTESDGPKSKVQEHVDALLGIAPSQTRACLMSTEIMRLSYADRAGLLRQIAAPDAVTLPDGRTGTAKDVEREYRVAYDRRREVSAELKGVGDPGESLDPPEGLAGKSLAELVALQVQVEAAIKKIDGQLTHAYAAIKERQEIPERLQARIVAIREELEQTGPPIPENTADDLAAKAKQLEAVSRDRAAALELARQAVADLKAGENAIRERCKAIEAGNCDNCPTCTGKLTKAKQAKIIENDTREMARLKKKLETAKGDLERAKESLRLVTRSIGETNAQINALATSAETAAKWLTRRKALEAELDTRTKEHEASVATIEDEVIEVQAQINELEEKARRGDTKRRELDQWIGTVRAAEARTRRYDELQAEHRELDRLVKRLDALGKTSQGGDLERFVAFVGSQLVKMGYEEFDLGPMVEASGDPIVNGSPAWRLSDGQQIEFGVALQIAFATWTGLGIVAVDRFESLDDGEQRRVAKLLQGSGHQVLIFQVLKDRDDYVARARKANAVDGLRFFLVERDDEGRSSVTLPREAAA